VSLDTHLRDVLHDSSFSLPGWHDPVGRIGRGIRRRRRKRLAIGGAVLAVLLAIPAVLSQQPFQDPPGLDSPIAFVDARVAAPAHLARRSPRPDAKPCARMSDRAWLQPDRTRPQVTTIMLPSAPAMERCTLRDNGETRLTATSKTTGQRQAFSIGGVTPAGAWQSPATIDGGGEAARLDVVAGNDCGQRFEAFTLEVLGVSYDLDLSTDCPPAVSDWYVEPPLLNAGLTVTMEAPDTVQRGQWFDYIVTVLSAMKPHTLSDCPVYLQRLGKQAVWRRLNCDRLKSFPAHQPVRFAMRAYVPPDQPPGMTQLSWMAVMSDGKVAIAEYATDGVQVKVL
jgi:hypothetical protein